MMDEALLLPTLLLLLLVAAVVSCLVSLASAIRIRGVSKAVCWLKAALSSYAPRLRARAIALRLLGFVSGTGAYLPMCGCVSWILCSLLLMLPLTAAEMASSLMTATDISTWAMLNSSIASAAGKSAVLTLSSSFAMTGYPTSGQGDYAGIGISTAGTAITIVGNNAVFDANKHGRFFIVDVGDGSSTNVRLSVSHVTFKNVSNFRVPFRDGLAQSTHSLKLKLKLTPCLLCLLPLPLPLPLLHALCARAARFVLVCAVLV